jgi:hypothetical protein
LHFLRNRKSVTRNGRTYPDTKLLTVGSAFVDAESGRIRGQFLAVPPNLPISALLIVADREARISSLAKAIGDRCGRVLFTTMDMVVGHSLAPIYYSPSTGWGVSISSQTLFTSREFLLANDFNNNNLADSEDGLLRQKA